VPEKLIDLHIHTTASDSLITPEEALDLAHKAGLSAVAFADHDTMEGFYQGEKKANDLGIELIPAVELSISYKGGDFHLLGYLLEHQEKSFKRKIEFFRNERLERGERMVRKLNELGINLTMDMVKRMARGGSVGRPHLADALLKEEIVRTYDEAFARYLGYHAPAYVPKKYLNPREGIDLIHSVKGVAVLAHPGTTKRDNHVPDLVALGLDGLEAYHSQYDASTVKYYTNLSRKFGLIYTGGSDCHGRRGEVLIGRVKVPYKCLEMLRRVKKEKFG